MSTRLKNKFRLYTYTWKKIKLHADVINFTSKFTWVMCKREMGGGFINLTSSKLPDFLCKQIFYILFENFNWNTMTVY